ncbi:MAG: tetratricopeptide repeat protein [bacterium]|nr:tetratricopeptide repeat protein [bacterium]
MSKLFNWRNAALSLALMAAFSLTAYAENPSSAADAPTLLAASSQDEKMELTDEEFDNLLDLAEQGDPEALGLLGILYYSGEGVKQDYAKALNYLNEAADAGNTDAMVILADMYANGKGVKTDIKKALEYLTKSAKAGNEHAQQAIKMLQEMEKKSQQEYGNDSADEDYGDYED